MLRETARHPDGGSPGAGVPWGTSRPALGPRQRADFPTAHNRFSASQQAPSPVCRPVRPRVLGWPALCRPCGFRLRGAFPLLSQQVRRSWRWRESNPPWWFCCPADQRP
jgi:hypothetical protein